METNVSTSKKHRNAENACVNGNLGLKQMHESLTLQSFISFGFRAPVGILNQGRLTFS